MILKLKKFMPVVVVASLALVAGLGWSVWEYSHQPSSQQISPGGDDRIPEHMIPYMMGQRLSRNILVYINKLPAHVIAKNYGGKYPKGYVGVNQLDFTLPTEEGFGDNPDWEVFNFFPGASKNKDPFDFGVFRKFKIIPKESKLYFTLGNRWQNMSSRPIPAAILTHIPDETCVGINKSLRLQEEVFLPEPKIGGNFVSVGDMPVMWVVPNLTPYSMPVPTENIVDLPYSTGCFKGADRINYFIAMSREIAYEEQKGSNQ